MTAVGCDGRSAVPAPGTTGVASVAGGRLMLEREAELGVLSGLVSPAPARCPCCFGGPCGAGGRMPRACGRRSPVAALPTTRRSARRARRPRWRAEAESPTARAAWVHRAGPARHSSRPPVVRECGTPFPSPSKSDPRPHRHTPERDRAPCANASTARERGTDSGANRPLRAHHAAHRARCERIARPGSHAGASPCGRR